MFSNTSVGSWLPLALQLFAGNNSTQGKAISNSFGHNENVGHNTVTLEGEPVASSSETRLDLIKDEQDVVLVADLSQSFEERQRGRNVSTLTQNWLNNNLCGSK